MYTERTTRGKKAHIYPTNLTYSTRVMCWKGTGGDRLASTASTASGCLVDYWAILPESIYDRSQNVNNRAEQSHEPTRVRERGMRRFKSVKQAQRFVTAHASVQNLFNLGRHLIRAEYYRSLRISAFAEWSRTAA